MSSSSGNAGSSAGFGQTLQFITTIKLQELEKQRIAYQSHSKVLESAASAKTPLERVKILLEGVTAWSGSGSVGEFDVVGGKLKIHDLRRWIDQATIDPSFSPDVLNGFADTLEQHIRHSLTKFECARLFGNLLNEWLVSGDSSTAAGSASKDTVLEESEDEKFIEIGRQELYEQREKLSSLIFSPADVDTNAIEKYLTELFDTERTESSLKSLRSRIQVVCHNLLTKKITENDVKNAIQGIIAIDLLSAEKRDTLQDFLQNTVVLNEVASVLNMRMASIDSWEWPQPILVEMRRHLNGKYRAFTDPEILDAILLHYIGISWQVTLKNNLTSFFTATQKSTFAPLTKVEIERRNHYLSESPSNTESIESFREQQRNSSFLLTQLTSNASRAQAYDDVVDTNGSESANSPAKIKQRLLHIMVTESILSKTLHQSHTIIRSDLEWFGPSLPHESILTILKFFGVTDKWLKFFSTFLHTPLRFKDDPAGTSRTRVRGTPIGYALSAACGELVLFGMDYAVNQRADGIFLYRMHDDLWLWDSKPERCAAGWAEMQRYASLVGLKFNIPKTGSASIDGKKHDGLPTGDIRWGFLKFDEPKARFVIDREDVAREVKELRRQLGATKSVFGWVNAWNKYMAFFIRNFGGRPANCFGKTHVDDMLKVLVDIQREVFVEEKTSGGPVGHLRALIKERFEVDELPQGYFYSPIESGGLELRDPLIELIAMRGNIDGSPEEEFTREMKRDVERYEALKKSWESSTTTTTARWAEKNKGEFMSFEEYTSARETRLFQWYSTYHELLEVVGLSDATITPIIKQAQNASQSTKELDTYGEWVICLYGDELMKRFGGLDIVDPSLIPIGMVQLFRSSRMKLDQ